ncbi:MAG: MarR family transcriptional regulator [Alphaproteobacteria bacterium]|nr:MarR family transcriptional regulator [Alphaproteobacteria bacterium]
MKNSAAQPGRRDHVLALCHMLSNRIGKAFAGELGENGITVAEWRVILTLALHETASGQEITNRWAMDKMAVNRAIASLEKSGAIEKKRNAHDKRTRDIRLTRAGRSLYDAVLPMANKRYRKLMAGLDQSEHEALHGALIKMIAHVDAVID